MGENKGCRRAAVEAMGKESLRDTVRRMQLVRRFEERAAREYAAGRISGFCHLYIGQEAVAVGALAALERRDHVITAYRDHGHALIRGCTPRSVMAELMGRVTGCARGRGGSMHMFSREENFHGGHGIVGAHVPLATGFAFASSYLGRDDVSICFLGEGAVNQGAFYESLNLASLWKLPVIYVIENNQFAMGTPLHRASAVSDLYAKAAAFAMEGAVVDGMDVAAMWEATRDAARRAREEKRPTLLEARCYRYRGHSMSDPAKYRTQDEVEAQKARDPIVLAANSLLETEWASREEIDGWDREAKEVAADAVDFALESPEPDLANVADYVYKDPLGWHAAEATTPHVREPTPRSED